MTTTKIGNLMVVVAVDLEPKLFDKIASTVSGSGYSSVQQFLVAAAWNQLTLDRTVPTASDTGPTTMPRHAQGVEASVTLSGSWRSRVERIDPGALGTLPLPDRLEDPAALLWGQTNRVLPIAVGIRVLANLLAERGASSIRLDEWHPEAASVAQAMRPELRAWDAAAGRKRGELWETAFPKADSGSAERFMAQFLGSPRRDGTSEGGAIFLGFAAFPEGRTSEITLTTSGAHWASFENPIFDGDAPTATFSAEETMFFLDHLRKYRPGELSFLATVAALVRQGKSRSELDDELPALFPQWANHVPTMRAGAIGRLSDLGLLGRERQGLTVEYHLTALADQAGLVEDQSSLR